MALQPALCARFHQAVELVGRRWTGAIIKLLLGGRMRYAELRGEIPDISDRMLSERLRELEQEGILARIVIPDTPVRVEYELTPKGRALERALAEIGRWAQRWISETPPRAADPDPTSPDRRSAKAPRREVEAPLRAHR
jgi:DNA-binding HxlR family transcriptional regulator